jgi:hypothetical protein
MRSLWMSNTVMKNTLLLLMLVALVSVRTTTAGPAAPPPDVNPNGPVIYFDGFERPMKYWNGGTLTTEKASRPETQSRKLAISHDKKSAYIQLRLSEMKVKLLNGAPSNAISVGVFVYGSEIKAVRIEFNGKETYSYTEDTIPNDKWTEVSCNVSQATRDKKKPNNDFEFTAIKITAIPKGGSAPTVYADDFILTAGVSPRAVWPQQIAIDTARASRTANVAIDGFEYSEPMDESLREQLKAAQRRPSGKGVLSVGLSAAKPGEAIVDKLGDALKGANARRTINAPVIPEGQKLATATDVRLFLPAMMKTDANDFVVFNLPPRAFMNLNAAEAVVISQRCTSVGAIPIWVVPVFAPGSKPEEAKKLDDNQKRLTKEFAAKGIPFVSMAHAIKDSKDAWDGEELKEDAQKALAKLTEAAIAHAEKNTKGRL